MLANSVVKQSIKMRLKLVSIILLYKSCFLVKGVELGLPHFMQQNKGCLPIFGEEVKGQRTCGGWGVHHISETAYKIWDDSVF